MASQRRLVLPALLLLLSGAIWFCYSFLDAEGGANRSLGMGDEVLAGVGAGALPAPNSGGKGGLSETSSGRVEIEVEPLVDPAELAAAEAEAEEPEGSRLRGKVVRAGGVPVAGALVKLRKTQRWFSLPADVEDMASMRSNGRLYEVETDEEGQFVFYAVPLGKYSLAIRAAGCAPLSRTDLEIPEHEDFDLGRFEMELGIQLAGKVVGLRGKGVQGVQVLCAVSPESGSTRLELPGHGIPLTTTDEEGRFEVDCLAPGSWHLIFDSPEYRVTELKGDTKPAGGTDRGLLVNLEPGLVIEGSVVGMDPVADGPLRVTARRNGDQPSGAAVEIEGSEKHRPRHAEVQADGTFVVRGLAAGVQFKLGLYRQDKAKPEDEEGVSRAWRKVRGVEDVKEMAGGGKVEFKYREEAAVLLVAKSSKSGKPLETFYVSVSGSRLGGSGTMKDESDEARYQFPGGEVRYENLLPAENGTEITVRLRAPAFEDFEKKGLMLRPGEELDLGEIELDPAPTTTVLVVDDESGKPIEGARVVCTKSSDSKSLKSWARWDRSRPLTTANVHDGVTDAKGIAKLTVWDGSICVAKAVAEGYQAGEEGRLIPPFTEQVELRLTRGGQITVKVVDGRGKAVAGMYVEHKIDGKNTNNNHRWDQDAQQENKTGDSGQVVFKNLAKGQHSFKVLEKLSTWGRGGESAGFEAEGDVFLNEGEISELELRVEARGGLTVTVLESGTPLEGALAKVSPVEGGSNDDDWYWGGAGQDPRSKVSDHAGIVKYEGLKVGRYNFKVSHGDRRMVVQREVLIAAEPDHITVDVGLAVIEGRVIDPSGEPIERVSMTVYAKDGRNRYGGMNDYRVRITEDEDGDADWEMDQVKAWSIYTDRDGRYVLRGVTPEVVLRVSASHNYVVSENREVGPLGSEEYVSPFDFVLERAGALRVDIPGVDRKTRERMRLYLARMEGEEEKETRSTRMRSWRSYTSLNSMRPGTWKLKLVSDDQEEPLLEQTVTIRIAETTRLTLNP